MSAPVFTPLGDAALSVQTPLARELLADLGARPVPGVQEGVPALGVLTVLFDPLQTSAAELEAALRLRLNALTPQSGEQARTRALPVIFGGPDLAWCAAHAGLSEAALITAVCAAPLEVAFLGFTPGFAFLSGLPPELQMPRLAAPRGEVPAGSFALGGPWAGVYPRATPGGWRIVGHTSVALFDLGRAEPVWWRAGDRIRVQPVAPE
ncbi:5-oxoprolinase subunit B family protein [Deinococcus aerophilus]|uniref:Carboxyltransferase domain-containing protein n=1 Tax=Deinococcus aerophilus TaxID=522488 RepID=A0ABQ2H0V0_9DEIO|nr:allophanate hydrolase subunit 1 [Deinococcus aerophilus]GGM21368.1 hypothetical protein GCM10010841_31590 [Deinococcus aerophilus]